MLAHVGRLSPRRATCLGAALVALLAAACFWPLLGGGRSVYFGDLGLYFIPQLAFQRRELFQGRIPLWNPHLLCGAPFVGNPQSWPLYPSSALLYLLPAHRAAGVIGVLHVAFAALGTLLFLRRRGLGVAPALLGAVAFAFGGALVSKMQFPNMVQAASYLPWLLWALDRALARPSVLGAAPLAALLGLALLAAHPQMFLMQFYLCAAWALWRGRSLPRQDRGAAAAVLLAAFALGPALAAGQLLPVVDVARGSVRAGLTLPQADRFFLPPPMLFTAFVLPNFWGNPALGDYVGRGNFWEPCAYMGLLPVALALGAVWKRSGAGGEVRFWAGAAVVALWLSLGRAGGLYAAAFYLLPGVGKFHDPARWLHVATFALACLAAAGLQALLLPLAPRPRLAAGGAALVLTVADLFPFTRALNPTVDARVFASAPPTARRLAALPAGRVFHADNGRVWSRFATYRTYAPWRAGGRAGDNAAHVRAFLDSLAPNLPALYGLLDVDGYEPVRGAAISGLREQMGRQVERTGRSGGRAPLLPAAGVRYVLSLGPRPLRTAGLGPPLAAGGGTRVQPFAAARPRATFWSGWQWAPTAAAARERFLSPAWDGTPVVPGLPAPPARGRAGRKALIVGEAPDRYDVIVPAGAGGGLLVVADTWHPGWKAYVDGRESAVAPVGGLFRGVPVRPGARRAAFRYRPAAWAAGLYVSLCGWGIVAGMAGYKAALGAAKGTRRSRARR